MCEGYRFKFLFCFNRLRGIEAWIRFEVKKFEAFEEFTED